MGVEPDLAVPAEEAFTVANQKALQHSLTTLSSPTVLTEVRVALAAQPYVS